MADVLTNEPVLLIDNLFVDGDTRTITLKNPKENITQSEITELNTFCQTNNILVGDKEGGNFGRITKVTKRTTTTRKLDFSA